MNEKMTNKFRGWIRKSGSSTSYLFAVSPIVDVVARSAEEAVAMIEREFDVKVVREYVSDAVLVKLPRGDMRYAFNNTSKEKHGLIVMHFAEKNY